MHGGCLTRCPACALQVRKALLAKGWDLAWIDGVTGEIQKRKLQATVPQIEAVVGPLSVVVRRASGALGAWLLAEALVGCWSPQRWWGASGRWRGCLPLRRLRMTAGAVVRKAAGAPGIEPGSGPLWRVALSQIDYLQGLGIPLKSVENMASINKAILGQVRCMRQVDGVCFISTVRSWASEQKAILGQVRGLCGGVVFLGV